MDSPMVAHVPEKVVVWRTLDGLTVVGTEDTHYCQPCDGGGTVRGRRCDCCEGSGRLLGADPYVWPVPVVEETSVGGAASVLREGRNMPANTRRPSPPTLHPAA